MKLFKYLFNSMRLIGFACRFLLRNLDLLCFPILSFIASISLLSLCWNAYAWLTPYFSEQQNLGLVIGIGLLFVAYFLLSVVIIFFNASLLSCTLHRLNGVPMNIAQGMGMAWRRWQKLLAWSLLSSTIGVILNSLEHSHQVIGSIIQALLGLAWSIGAYFVLPILLLENIGPIDALKRGYRVFGQGWRKTVSVNAVLCLGMFLGVMLISLIFDGPFHFNIQLDTHALIDIALIIVGLLILSNVFHNIIVSSLYLSIVEGKNISGLSEQAIQDAFIKK